MRQRRYEMQKCNDNKNILIWDNELQKYKEKIKGVFNE